MKHVLMTCALATVTGCEKKQATPEPQPAAEPRSAPVAVPTPAEPAPPPAPPKEVWGEPVEIPPRDEATDIALHLDDARTYVEARDPELAAYRLELKYVRSDGALDPTYGELSIFYGISQHTGAVVDDPSRPTGAPIPEVRVVKPRPAGTRCPNLTFHAAHGWKSPRYFCVTHDRIVGPRCSVKTIWDRAIAKGAPKDALAVLEVVGSRNAMPQLWRFRITDRLRKINVSHTIPDDCEVTVEK